MHIKGNVQSNVRVTVVDRATGKVKRIHHTREHNTVTNIDKLLDLMDGSATGHLDANSDIIIKDDGGSTVASVLSCASGYPTTPASGSVTWKWEDISTDTYNPDDVYLQTSGGTVVAEALAVGWADKTASENWFFEWDLSISSGDSNFDDAGFNGMLDCVVNRSTPGGQHWDGTEAGGSTNMHIKVYDGTPGSLEFSLATTADTVRTTTSLKWIFVKSPVSATWGRVEVRNEAQGNLLYDDDITNDTQTTSDTFTYEFTVTFADS